MSECLLLFSTGRMSAVPTDAFSPGTVDSLDEMTVVEVCSRDVSYSVMSKFRNFYLALN